MKGSMHAALALGVGYALGRRRKMRLATMLAAATATGGLGGMAVQRAMKVLGSGEALDRFAPQLGDLADTVRSDLMDAGKAAATAAVTSRIEALAESLHERAELVRNPSAAVSGASKAARSGAGEAARSADEAARRTRRRGQDAAGVADAAGPREEEEPYFEEPEEPEGYEPGDSEPEAVPSTSEGARTPGRGRHRPGRPRGSEGRPQRVVRRRPESRGGDSQ